MILTTSLRATVLVTLAVFAAGCGGGGIEAGDWKPLWNENCPSWSPDGSTIAFGRGQLYEHKADGVYLYDVGRDNLRRLVPDALEVLAWSLDRRELVVSDGRELALLSVRTGTSRRLVNLAAKPFAALPDPPHTSLVPAPDLRALIVESQRASTTDDPLDYRDEVWVVDVKSPRARMVSLPKQKFAGNASWSPDGQWIAYDDLDHIYLVRGDGSDRRVVPTRKFAEGAVFSPDGRALAYFSSLEEERSGGAFLVDLVRGTNRQLAAGAPAAWSRDGRTLLALSAGGVVVINSATGEEVARLPDFGGAWPGTGVHCPAFSPDGSEVAFLRSWPGGFAGSTSAVYLAPASLTTARPIDPAGR
jgi:Tol biopolymer transport system component